MVLPKIEESKITLEAIPVHRVFPGESNQAVYDGRYPSPFPSPPDRGRGLPAFGGAEGDQGRGEGGARERVNAFVRVNPP